MVDRRWFLCCSNGTNSALWSLNSCFDTI